MRAIAPISTRAKSAARWHYNISRGRAEAAHSGSLFQAKWVPVRVKKTRRTKTGRWMRTELSNASSADFEANRARGAVSFDVQFQDGTTRRRRLHESGSLRVRFPSPEGEGLSAVFVNTAGGIAGGDRFDTEIAVGEGAQLTLTTAAAEKVYRAHSEGATLNIALKAAAGARLA